MTGYARTGGMGRRRQDCHCGALVGLFFELATMESYSEGNTYHEYHFAADTLRRCTFFINSAEVAPDRLGQFLLNTADTRPDKQAGCDVGTEGGVPRGIEAGRAAETMERYAAMPDNP